MVIFSDVQYCIRTDLVDGWVRKSPNYAEVIEGWSFVLHLPVGAPEFMGSWGLVLSLVNLWGKRFKLHN